MAEAPKGRKRNILFWVFFLVIAGVIYYLSLWPAESLVVIELETDELAFRTATPNGNNLVEVLRPGDYSNFYLASSHPLQSMHLEAGSRRASFGSDTAMSSAVEVTGPTDVTFRLVSSEDGPAGLNIDLAPAAGEAVKYSVRGNSIVSAPEGGGNDSLHLALPTPVSQKPASAGCSDASQSADASDASQTAEAAKQARTRITLARDVDLESVQLYSLRSGKPRSLVHKATIHFPAGERDDIEVDQRSLIVPIPAVEPAEGSSWVLHDLAIGENTLHATVIGVAADLKTGPAEQFMRQVLPSKLTFHQHHDPRFTALAVAISLLTAFVGLLKLRAVFAGGTGKAG